MRPTYHLLPTEAWRAAELEPAAAYAAPSLAVEGFIHCTDGAAALIDTANRYYRDDPRPYLALTIDLDAAGSPWTIDDPAGIYPHVYGSIERAAIIAVQPLIRAADGAFLRIADEPSA
jgi:uncharacterized protein (DUF952 family)